MAKQQPPALRVGIVGCGEGTHGKVWGEMLASPAGARFGMKPVLVWDADPAAAEGLAKATGAAVASTPEAAGEGVDGVLITELLPARYLRLARPFLEAGKRVFFNRPFAGSVADARSILQIAQRHDARVYSASALYHTAAGDAARAGLDRLGAVRLFNVTGPTDHLGFYLPHAIAALVSVLGPGIETVRSVSLQPGQGDPQRSAGPVVVYAEYGGARQGARGVIEMVGPDVTWYGFTLKLFGARAAGDEVQFEVSYDRLLETMARFFRTGEEPIPRGTMLEMTAVHYAALASARDGGRAVSVRRMLGARDGGTV